MDRRENNILLASPPHCYLGISTELNSTGGNTGILFADENPWNKILFKEQISGKTNSPQERDRLLVILRHLGSGFRNGLDIKSSAVSHQSSRWGVLVRKLQLAAAAFFWLIGGF